MSAQRILVAGDFVLDHHIYEGRRHHYGEPAELGVRVYPQLGGAALVVDILRVLLPGSVDSACPRQLPSEDYPNTSGSAYAYWRPCPPKEPRERQFWRVDEAMGFGDAERDLAHVPLPLASIPAGPPDIVVLSEGGMGFRNSPEAWPKKALRHAKWIVFKTTAPLCEGPLWSFLTKEHRHQLVLSIGAHDLRKMAARVSQGLSWEETLGNVLRELRPKGALHALTGCRHLVISFDVEGALWIDFGKGSSATRVHFIHDAAAIEGERGHTVEGSAFGFQSCLAAALAWQLSQEQPEIPCALESGLASMRDLQEKGHGPASDTPAGFPAARLAGVITHPPHVYSRAVFHAGSHTDSPAWSMLGESLPKREPAYDLARLVLLRGPIALASLPHLRIGNLLTADRQEIEALRSLVQVVRRYQKHDPGKKPLSLAVFGPPGAGKSFAVRELASQVIKNAGWLEFNLSQFNDADDLIGAFHQIRDQVLQGKLPVAFFDEFDAHSYKWLAGLLAPMQDGKFQDGQITHTLGKCVFVFAGGTSWTFDTFGPPLPQGQGKEPPEWREFRLAKGPDFKSRLDGFLDVVGPNQRRVPAGRRPTSGDDARRVGGHVLIKDPLDVCFPIRRALMIRAELKCRLDEKLDVDEGLVNAWLRIDNYTHGARSLGKILQPFVAARPQPLRRSLSLPASQLGMHVDAKEFVLLCGPPPNRDAAALKLTEEQIGTIAPAIHETWRALGRKSGNPNPLKDKPFTDLLPFDQDSNQAAAGRMLDNLKLVGLKVAKGLATPKAERDVRDQLEYVLETLAEAEHEGWMQFHLAHGWRWAKNRDDKKKLHPCLRPYHLLPKVDVEKDRDSVRHYPDYARLAGMKIVRS